MVSYDSGGAAPEAPVPGFFARAIFNSGHKAIGLRYLWLALGSVLLGMFLSLLMRIHFGSACVSPERINANSEAVTPLCWSGVSRH